jgi:hypothetical protein
MRDSRFDPVVKPLFEKQKNRWRGSCLRIRSSNYSHLDRILMKTAIAALAVAASLALPGVASANIFKVNFTATEFNTSNGSVPPQDTVAGSVLFAKPSSENGAPSVIGIDLTIGSHTYTIDEIVADGRGGGYGFGGKASGLDGLANGTDDFYFYVLGRDERFGYTTAGIDGNWGTRVLRLRTEEIATVPEPGSLALLLIGAGGVGAIRRRRRIQG